MRNFNDRFEATNEQRGEKLGLRKRGINPQRDCGLRLSPLQAKLMKASKKFLPGGIGKTLRKALRDNAADNVVYSTIPERGRYVRGEHCGDQVDMVYRDGKPYRGKSVIFFSGIHGSSRLEDEYKKGQLVKSNEYRYSPREGHVIINMLTGRKSRDPSY